jgi:hypothetical protein
MRPLLKSKNAWRIVLGVAAVALVWMCFQLGTRRHTGIGGTQFEARQFPVNSSSSPVVKQPRGSASAGPQHSVNLSWKASTSAVAGYNVYRRDAWGLTKVNSAPVTGTTYLDSSVQPGQTYYYVTKSVSSTGTESSPSNEVRVVVPSP